jgi:hypothetical protein
MKLIELDLESTDRLLMIAETCMAMAARRVRAEERATGRDSAAGRKYLDLANAIGEERISYVVCMSGNSRELVARMWASSEVET